MIGSTPTDPLQANSDVSEDTDATQTDIIQADARVTHADTRDSHTQLPPTPSGSRPAPILKPRKAALHTPTSDDMPSTPLFASLDEMPSALHNLSDAELSKIIDRHGPLFLVRQLSRDLAQREKELMVVTKQHADRERELKTMLAECDVSVIEIERRLSSMKVTSVVDPDRVINEALQEALDDSHHPQETESRSLFSITKAFWDTPKSSRSLLSVKSSFTSLKSFMDDSDEKQRTITIKEEHKSVKEEHKTQKEDPPVFAIDTPRSIEMTAIFDPNVAPPTLKEPNDLLTDRYGFKYEWRKKSKDSKRTIDNSSEESVSVDDSGSKKLPETNATITKTISNAFQEPPSRSAPTATLSLTNRLKDDNNTMAVSSVTPVKLLLSQLSQIHDTQQKVQLHNWKEFLDNLTPLSDEHDENSCNSNVLDFRATSLKSQNSKLYKSFVSLVLAGIPVKLRPQIWSQCSGADAMKVPGLYSELFTSANTKDMNFDPILEAQNTSQIDLDLYRTMPHNTFFGNGPGVAKLRNVLVAVSRHNPDTGYCQGMNIMAAVMLLAFPTEEDAFWALVALTNMLPTNYLAPPLLVSRADQKVLKSYIDQYLPQISHHMDSLEIDLEAITFSWFLSCFADTLPPEVLFRIWDVFLCHEGMPFLFKTALALFKKHQSHLLTLDSAADYYTFTKNVGDKVLSVDNLLKIAQDFDISQQDVDTRRKHALAELSQ